METTPITDIVQRYVAKIIQVTIPRCRQLNYRRALRFSTEELATS